MKSRRRAFTLIEIMVAVLLLALLSSAVAMSFSRPLQAARGQDAIAILRGLDSTARRAAISRGQGVRMVFDLSRGAISRRDGADLTIQRSRSTLPPGLRIAEMRIDGSPVFSGEARVDVSASGWSRSYSVHLVGPSMDQWIVVAGLTGTMLQVQDETAIKTDSISSRHNLD